MRDELKDLIYSDLYRYTGKKSWKLYFKYYMKNPGFKFMCRLRKSNFYKGKKIYLINYVVNRIILKRLTIKYGYEIPYLTQIGKGFFIGHINGIAINQTATIGNNVSISKGVTIGHVNRGKRYGTPTIGDMVWMGTNAVIVGNVKVGNNVLIAPNAYVNFDVPDHSIVLGNPGEIISKENPTDGYIVYPVND